MTITLRFLIEILYLLAASSIKISILSVATTFFTPEIKSIILATNVLKSGKNKKEVKNDLLSMMAPPIIQSCSQVFLNSPSSLHRNHTQSKP